MTIKKYHWLALATILVAGYALLTLGTYFSTEKSVLGAIDGVDGSGIEGDPYLLDSCTDISNLANDYNDGTVSTTFHARVTQDIDCSGVANLLPIATSTSNGFAGVFDGGGFTISEITMDYADDDSGTGFTGDSDGARYVGLFGVIDGGEVRNVILEDSFIKGYQYVGGIVGRMESGSIWRTQVNLAATSVNSVTSTCSSGDGCVWARYGREGGGIVGYMSTGTLSYVQVGGSVRGSGTTIGGVIGRMISGFVTEAENRAWVDGGSTVGGIVGQMQNGTIEKSFSTGNVTAFSEESTAKPGYWAGGFAGVMADGTITNSYSIGDVSASTQEIGGFIGDMNGTGGTLINVYSAGAVILTNTSSAQNVGGFIGSANDFDSAENIFFVNPLVLSTTTEEIGAFIGDAQDVTDLSLTNVWYVSSTVGVADCVYDSATATTTNPAACNIASATSTFQNSSNEPLASWNFSSIWQDGSGGFPYPTLATTTFFDGGYGTPENPYIIRTCEQLQEMEDYLYASYEIDGVDIDCSGSAAWNGGSGFDPVGTSSTPFTGTFDGGGFTIDDLYIDRADDTDGEDAEDENFVGLFGATQDATLTDIHLRGAFVKGYQHVGGIVGWMGTSTVLTTSTVNVTTTISGNEDCSANECVWGSYGQNTGAIVGNMHRGTVINVESSGPVIGPGALVGGVVGYMNTGTLQYASTSAYVDGSYIVGGLIGGMAGGSIDQSFAAGEVVVTEETSITSPQYAGGFIAFMSAGSITNAFATADVTGPTNPTENTGIYGGFAGIVGANGTIDNTYSTGVVTATGTVGVVSVRSIGGYAGGLTLDGTVTDSFTVSPVQAVSGSTYLAAFGGEAVLTVTTNTADLYFDASSTGYAYCITHTGSEVTSTPDFCTAINEDGSQADYFYIATNDVFEDWDFENVWQERLADYPVLAMGGEITAVDREEEEEEEESESEPEESSGGGGGGGIFVIKNKKTPNLEPGTSAMSGALEINGGAATTKDRNVTLTINASDVNQIAVSEDITLSGAQMVDYTGGTVSYVLSPEYGVKTVYVKLQIDGGEAITVQDSIEFVSGSSASTNSQSSGTSQKVTPKKTGCPLTEMRPYKLENSPTVYYISEDCRRYAFANPAQFYSYFDSFSEVQMMTQSEYDRTPGAADSTPWGPKYRPEPSGFLQSLAGDDRNIYVTVYGKKHKVASPSLFEAIGYDLSWIEPASPELIDALETGIEHTRTDIHPDFTLIKYNNSVDVYRLELGTDGTHVRRLIVDEDAFNRNGFRWDRIIEVNADTYHVFPDGPFIE